MTATKTRVTAVITRFAAPRQHLCVFRSSEHIQAVIQRCKTCILNKLKGYRSSCAVRFRLTFTEN